MSQKIVPNVWCNRNAEEAAGFYTSIFRASSSEVTGRYPDEVPDWQREFSGQPVTVDLLIDGYRIVLINAGDEFRPNPSISFILNFHLMSFDRDERATSDRMGEVWTALADGGRVLMPLQEYPFSPLYGWVEDRYGVSWQFTRIDADGDPGPFIVPQLMFAGRAQGRAREAAEFYSTLLEDSGVGFTAPYPQQTGPAAAGDVMFGEFRLAGQRFSMMDSGVEQDFTFTPGLSLEVRCDGQAEIDRLWDALSAVPEAEQCGWLADRYGVSWQIVPDNMGDLMRRPGAYPTLMAQGRIVIADY